MDSFYDLNGLAITRDPNSTPKLVRGEDNRTMRNRRQRSEELRAVTSTSKKDGRRVHCRVERSRAKRGSLDDRRRDGLARDAVELRGRGL